MDQQRDLDLVTGCVAGQRAAQHRLYKKYADAMYNICCRMTNDTEAASEVLQDSFMAVFEKIATYNHQSTLGAWIKKIVIHKCIDYIRLKKMSFAEINESITAIPETDETPVHINVDVIRDAISQLPEGYRLVFTLYAMEGYDHEEIAHILKISEQTSKSQYHRAKGKIKEWIYKNGQMEALYN